MLKTLRAWSPGPVAANLDLRDLGTSVPGGCAPVLAATTRLRALAGLDTAPKSVRTCPRAPEPTFPSRPAVPHESPILGGQAEEVRESREATKVGGANLVTSGIANLLAQLVWRRSSVQLC